MTRPRVACDAMRRGGQGVPGSGVRRQPKPNRAQLRKAIAALHAGDVLMVTRLDRLARSTRDLLNTLAAITGSKAVFRSLGDAWADTTTAHGRLMLTVLVGPLRRHSTASGGFHRR
jgi:DNA invertase Pin-like site-specific DNA recombinase